LKIKQVYKWLFNNQQLPCLLCQASGPHAEHGLCTGCHADLPWLGYHCRQCAIPLPQPDARCGQCQQRAPAFSQVVCPLLYRFPLDSLIPAFKHHEQLTYGRLLGRLLAEHVQHHYHERQLQLPDLLVPMPLFRGRLAQRGFNQAHELARPVARLLQLPLSQRSLQRIRPTPAQQGLSARERRRNLQDAFSCSAPEHMLGRHVALIDDVLTTGASADEASRVLLAAGALSVSVWCVARTP